VRILWVAHFAGIDGANLNLVDGIDSLSSRGHESYVVLPQEGPIRTRLGAATEIRIHHHNQWISGRRIGVAHRLRWAAYNYRAAGREIASFARESGADIIVSNTMGVIAGGVAARRAGVTHVWFLHELVAREFGYRFLLGRRPTMALVRRLADGVITVGDTVAHHVSGHLRGVDVSVARPWIRVTEPQPEQPPLHPERPFRLVSVGSLIPGKRQIEAIDAVALLRDAGVHVDLELVGGTEQWFRADLERRAREQKVGDRVAFTPFQADPAPCYLRADAAVMCSPKDALPRAAVEPLKLARPVIAPAAGGLAEIVTEGRNGLLYRPGDTADLARRIAELDRDRSLLRELGERGRRDALDTFNGERMGAALEAAMLLAQERAR
jgi:glycosyltransferase involved in cell wall biosynthesis